jgi:hypothetical protein
MPYFDPHAEAQMNGFAHGNMVGESHGRKIGFREGQQNGYDIGYADGKTDGYNDGWNAAVVVADREILKQIEFTAYHSGERQRLETDVRALRELIVQFHMKCSELEAQAKNHVSQHHEAVWQVNRCAVFMNSTRAVLEDLIGADSTQIDHVRQLFAKRYLEQVAAALKKGTILTPLDTDEKLTTTMPRTQKFIRYMLATSK